MYLAQIAQKKKGGGYHAYEQGARGRRDAGGHRQRQKRPTIEAKETYDREMETHRDTGRTRARHTQRGREVERQRVREVER